MNIDIIINIHVSIYDFNLLITFYCMYAFLVASAQGMNNVYVYIYKYMYTYACICILMHSYVHTNACICMYITTNICIYIRITYLCLSL
jgi:hypothetical protein